MIEKFKEGKRADYCGLLNFIKKDLDYDFYYTHENSRIYLADVHHLKQFIRASNHVYVLEENGEYVGVILLWKSVGGGKERHYLKLKATDQEVAKKLITVLLWNTKKEVYAKIRKDNNFLPVLRNKGFRFLGGRGIQVLLSFKPKKEKDNAPGNDFIKC